MAVVALSTAEGDMDVDTEGFCFTSHWRQDR